MFGFKERNYYTRKVSFRDSCKREEINYLSENMQTKRKESKSKMGLQMYLSFPVREQTGLWRIAKKIIKLSKNE